jgi:hypothetical protein
MTSVFALILVPCVIVSAVKADQTTVQAPKGYILIEEEHWYLLADEPGRHIGRARLAFQNSDLVMAAAEIRKAAVHLKIEANNASERTKRGLIHAEHDLEQTARRIEAGTIKSAEDLDLATARAMHTLSQYQYDRATEAWQKKEVRRAGHYLRAAADNIEHAAARTEFRMKEATAEIARDSRRISGTMIEGTGYVFDDVGKGLEAFGHQIERVGTRVLPPPAK